LAAVCPELSGLGYFHFLTHEVEVGQISCWVSRLGFTGELGYEHFCRLENAGPLWQLLLEVGARPFGLAAVETLRIEAGLHMVGAEFHPGTTNPFDLSFDPFIRLDGESYLGRGALRDLAAQAHRGLATLALDVDSGVVPAQGAAVSDTGAQIGHVTSACRSPTLGRVIALACVERASMTPGRCVRVATESGWRAATVAPTPIYDSTKRRRLA
jgi:aminomethyltransferase